MNSLNLDYPYKKLHPLGDNFIRVIAKFHNPRHTGNKDRIRRLQEEAELVITMASALKYQVVLFAKHECMKSDICRQKIEKHLSQLIDDWRQLRRSTQDEETIFFSDSSSNGEEEEEEEDDVTEVRIARVFVKKRYLLNIINFIYDNEERIAQMNTKHIARLTELVQEETTEWMELLDYLQTIKNPRYLDNMWFTWIPIKNH